MLEIQLIEKCLNGDDNAFKQLLWNYHNQLYGYLRRFSSSQFEAEEMFQETLIKVWRGLKKYNNQQKFSAWLFTIAHNVAMDVIRKNKKHLMLSSIDNEMDIKGFSNPDEDLINKERSKLIEKSINGLPEKQKSVFLLRQHGELTFREIAEITKEPLNTVISHMHYAIKKIKNKLTKEDEPRRTIAI